MNDLTKLVTILNNDDKSVILKVKKNKRIPLIKLACFNGDEDMIRVTKNKGDSGHLTYTIFKQDGSHFSWDSNTLVCESMKSMASMICQTVVDDFGIILRGDANGITNYIKTINDDKKKSHVFKSMWFNENEISVHKDGIYWKHFNGIDNVKKFLSSKYNIAKEEDSRSPRTDCFIKTFYTKA